MESKLNPRSGTAANSMLCKAQPAYFSILIASILGIWMFPVLHGDFLFWDDDINITANKYLLESASWQWNDLNWIWKTDWISSWRPVNWLLYAPLYWTFGLDPLPFHLAALLLHIANALLLFHILNELQRAKNTATHHLYLNSLLIVLLWALHPHRAEPVSFISALAYPQAMFFLLLAVLLSLQYAARQRNHVIFISGIGMLTGLSSLSHPLFISAPLICMIVYAGHLYQQGEFSKIEKSPKRTILAAIVISTIPAISAYVTFFVSGKESTYYNFQSFTFSPAAWLIRFLRSNYTNFEFLSDRILYNTLPENAFLHPEVISGTFIAIGLIIIASISIYRRGFIWLVILGFYISTIPTIGTAAPNTPLADRYTYLGGVFVAILIFLSIHWLLQQCKSCNSNYQTYQLLFITGLLLTVCALHFRRESAYYRNTYVLIEKTIEDNTDETQFPGLITRMALQYQKDGARHLSLAYLNEALRLNPVYAPALRTRIRIWLQMGMLAQAQDDLRLLMAIEPEETQHRKLYDALEDHLRPRATLEVKPSDP